MPTIHIDDELHADLKKTALEMRMPLGMLGQSIIRHFMRNKFMATKTEIDSVIKIENARRRRAKELPSSKECLNFLIGIPDVQYQYEIEVMKKMDDDFMRAQAMENNFMKSIKIKESQIPSIEKYLD